MSLKKITDVTDLKGKYVLVRSSLNIPLQDNTVRNSFRIKRALPTLRYLHEAGARTIILSHLGRKPEESLKPVFEELSKNLPIHWGGAVTGDEFISRKDILADGEILMAENLRQDTRERENDPEFVTYLSSLGEIYVNDAFAEAHREHASTFGLAQKLPAYAGLTLEEEVAELSKVMQPKSPSLFLLGGAKFETKMPLVEKYLELYDQVFIAGALMNDIFKAKGYEVGKSLVSDISLTGSAILDNPKLIIPIDVVVDGPDGKVVKAPNQVLPEESIMDVGPLTVDMLVTYIEKAQTVLWNGPFGAYEMGYTQSTEKIAKHAAESDAFCVIGGGDTVAAIEKLELNDQYGFVSSGGGAMLAFLENGSTSVIENLKETE
jgi:phosphoglycerate kinase